MFWISGDTVLYDGLDEMANRREVGIALSHLGGVRFRVSGPSCQSVFAMVPEEVRETIRWSPIPEPIDRVPEPA